MSDQPATAPEIRKTLIAHEASLRGAALLYYFISAIIAVGAFMLPFGAGEARHLRALDLAVATILLGLAVLYAVLARGIQRLKPWSRTPTTVLTCIGLLGFPLGTLINGYILYLLHCEKGKTIFSPGYRQVVLQTPEVEYKTPVVLWALLGIVILIFLVIIIGVACTIDWGARASRPTGAPTPATSAGVPSHA